VDDDSLALFDIREGGYDRVQIPWDHVSSYSEQPLPTDGNLWIYVSSETNLTPLAERPIMMSYVDVILNGCLDFSEEFAQQFIAQTDQWQNLVDDRANPKYVRPLATSERLVTIESIIKKLRPELWKTRQFVK
jgi:hypothetical protein